MKKNVNYFLIIIFGIFANHWIISPKNGFVFDDWAYLYKFKFMPIEAFLKILPDSTYNDRPVGELFLKTLFGFFYDNYQLYHSVLLIIHITNAILVFQILSIAINNIKPKFQSQKTIALLSAIIFVIWPKSTMAVQWNSAIFDLLGTFLALIIIRLYLYKTNNISIKTIKYFLIISLFFITLRTKEMFIVLPAILFVYEVIKNYSNFKKNLNQLFNPIILTQTVIAALYAFLLIRLKTNNQIVNDLNSPYFMSFNPFVLIENLFKYIFLYFNFGSVEFSFTQYNNKSILLVIGFLVAAIIIILKYRKNIHIILGVVLLLPISLLTVLPLKNLQHGLYLYFPSIILAFFISVIMFSFVKQFTKNHTQEKYLLLILISVITFITTNNRSLELYRNFWFSVAENNIKTYKSISQIKSPEKESTIYVLNVNDQINSFIQGHGAIFWFTYNDPSLKMELNPTSIDKNQNHYLILNYQDDIVTEIERK